MPYVRAAHREAPVRPPITTMHQVVAHRPVNRHRPVVPRIFPILQAPTFPLQSDFIYEEIDERKKSHTEKRKRSAILDHNHGNNIIPVRMATYVPQQNYPRQPYLRLSTRPIRYAEPKYSAHLYVA